ncbi:hypothetical protein KDA82_03625, partial [Streptomyces daliensis]|nr:hypothetical protein [Streptomyces daliensis]
MRMARRTVSRTVLVAVCALAVVAGFLVYRWWNDPLDDACGGSLSTVLVPDALGGDEDGSGDGATCHAHAVALCSVCSLIHAGPGPVPPGPGVTGEGVRTRSAARTDRTHHS